MTTEILENLATQIDDVFFLIGGVIPLIELAEAWFKGSLKGRKIMEMVTSASTQIPSIAFETFVMTGAYAVYYIIAEAVVTWSIPTTWWSIALAPLVADFLLLPPLLMKLEEKSSDKMVAMSGADAATA